jgi:hypothetical protein
MISHPDSKQPSHSYTGNSKWLVQLKYLANDIESWFFSEEWPNFMG